jgi:hypothetical protein
MDFISWFSQHREHNHKHSVLLFSQGAAAIWNMAKRRMKMMLAMSIKFTQLRTCNTHLICCTMHPQIYKHGKER